MDFFAVFACCLSGAFSAAFFAAFALSFAANSELGSSGLAFQDHLCDSILSYMTDAKPCLLYTKG